MAVECFFFPTEIILSMRQASDRDRGGVNQIETEKLISV